MKILNTRYTTEEILALFPDAKNGIKEAEVLAKQSIHEPLTVYTMRPARQLTSSLAEDKKCAIHLDVYYGGSYALYGAIPEEGNSQASANYAIFMMCSGLWSAQFTIACNGPANEISSVSGGSSSPAKEGYEPIPVTATAKISNSEAEMAIDETLTFERGSSYSLPIHFKLTATTTSTSISSAFRKV
ncbi:MAG: hypothetical protein LBC69_00010 [Eubacteriaceae bacterium]|jgi:hypothetical protein|nr:hypothetical protein [Eubacteriaceae bacterium]